MVDSKSKTRLLVVTVILIAAIGYMIFDLLGNSSSSSLSYYRKISDVTSNPAYIGKDVRVRGKILTGSVSQKGRVYTFKIFDKNKQLTITYDQQLPSTFGGGVQAIVEGKLVSRNLMEATSVTTQCPTKYTSKK